MPVRATKRGAERTPLHGDRDVLVCGASFAGLAVARALAGTGARVLVIDRYEVGERQTSACGIPTGWLHALGLEETIEQTFSGLLFHTPHTTVRCELPYTLSTFDYQRLCALLFAQSGAVFETATVEGRTGDVVHTDRGDLTAPLVVDALGWRRVLSRGEAIQPPDAPLTRGLEVHPAGPGHDLEFWIDRSYVRAGYGWSFPAGEERRIGVGSYDPRVRVREPTVRLAGELGGDADRFQGNWIPHTMHPATEDGVFFVGDSAGHCVPMTAEGIRTALYFGLACGRELRAVLEGRVAREEALARYHAFSESHGWKFRAMLRIQRVLPRVPPRLLGPVLRALAARRFVLWSFGHYLRLAPPPLARDLPAPATRAALPVGSPA